MNEFKYEQTANIIGCKWLNYAFTSFSFIFANNVTNITALL